MTQQHAVGVALPRVDWPEIERGFAAAAPSVQKAGERIKAAAAALGNVGGPPFDKIERAILCLESAAVFNPGNARNYMEAAKGLRSLAAAGVEGQVK